MAPPVVVYQSAVRDGDRGFTFGQLPMKNSQLMTPGKLGGAVSMLSAMSPMRLRRTGSLVKAGSLVPYAHGLATIHGGRLRLARR